jgi:HlyD family secretion protein
VTNPTGTVSARKGRWLPYAGLALVAGFLVYGFWPRPIAVETAHATVGPLQTAVSEEGKTRIKHRYVISAPVGGQLRRIPFKAGAEVKAHETVVAIIDPLPPILLDARSRATAEARRDAARANLEKARDGHAFATSELHRNERLFKDRTISPQEFDSFQWRETSAAREETAAESALRQAEAELAQFSSSANSLTNSPGHETTVMAPITGRVLKVLEENARVVTPGMPLLEVGDPADLEVVVDVLSRDGAVIAPGTRVEFDQWGGPEPLQGKVRLVEPAAFTKISALGVEEQRVNVIADFITPSEQRTGVGDNFRVEARIIVWEAADALKVPAGALFRQGDQWAIFVIENGRAKMRTVKVGHSSGTETQILDGLRNGKEIILYPGSRVKEGQRVTPVKI